LRALFKETVHADTIQCLSQINENEALGEGRSDCEEGITELQAQKPVTMPLFSTTDHTG